MILLAKPKLNSIEILISKTLIHSNTSHDEIVLIKKCAEIILYERKIKNSNNK